jgi:hypothetical protein
MESGVWRRLTGQARRARISRIAAVFFSENPFEDAPLHAQLRLAQNAV